MMMSLDKQLHFAVSYGLTLSLAFFLTVPVAALIVLAIGALKETFDYFRPLTYTADWMDFAADACGVAVACTLLKVI
jgi:hypothetical protein